MKTRSWIRLTGALAVASLAALGVAHLALTDIARGEPDLRLEWFALQLSALVVLAFHAATLGLVLRMRPPTGDA